MKQKQGSEQETVTEGDNNAAAVMDFLFQKGIITAYEEVTDTKLQREGIDYYFTPYHADPAECDDPLTAQVTTTQLVPDVFMLSGKKGDSPDKEDLIRTYFDKPGQAWGLLDNYAHPNVLIHAGFTEGWEKIRLVHICDVIWLRQLIPEIVPPSFGVPSECIEKDGSIKYELFAFYDWDELQEAGAIVNVIRP